MSSNLLMKYMSPAGYQLSQTQIKQFLDFEALLIDWNKIMNLTGITESSEIYEKHFVDSLTCFKSNLIKPNMKVIDVGTGAGFPGVPIKIFMPSLNITLLDALNKRLDFLKVVSTDLDLDDIEFLHGRAEDYGKDEYYREKYDIVVSRAVADLPVLLEYCSPFLKVGGFFIAQKGKKVFDEIKEAESALKILNLKVEEIIPIKINEITSHHLLILKKIDLTPNQYPRRSGKPTKKPL
jgi:16S rRNA (guanine527-N7)-methyltransferase